MCPPALIAVAFASLLNIFLVPDEKDAGSHKVKPAETSGTESVSVSAEGQAETDADGVDPETGILEASIRRGSAMATPITQLGKGVKLGLKA